MSLIKFYKVQQYAICTASTRLDRKKYCIEKYWEVNDCSPKEKVLKV